MKRDFLKKQRNVAVVLATIATAAMMCAFSMADKDDPKDPPKDKKPVVAFAHLNPQPDSVAVSIFGEDVAAIVFGAKKATLSHLNPMEPPADGEATIGGVKVSSTLGTLNKTDLITLQFLMADSAFYNNGVVTVTAPFAPNYALSFLKGKQRVDLIFSLQSCEVGVVVNGILQRVIRYTHAREITRYFRIVSQNNLYDSLIAIQ